MIKRLMIVIIGLFLIPTSVFANGLLDDLESYYALEETTGSTFADSSVNGLDASTQTGSPTLAQTGINGNAIGFTDDRIGYSYGAYGSGGEDIINATNSVLSFSYWVKPTSSSQTGCNVVIGQNHGSGSKIAMGSCQGGTTSDNNGNNVIGLSEATAWLATTSTYNTNNWNHVVMTWNYNTGYFKQYLNGALIKTDSSSLYNTGSSDDVLFQIGGYLPSRMIDSAVIDEVALWRKELDANDVSRLYNSGSGLFYSSFTALSPLEQGLERYYTFDSVNDDETGNYDAVDVNAISYDTGNKKLGSASVLYNANFEGKQVGQLNTDIHGGTQEFTYNFWVELDAVNTGASYDDWTINDWQGVGGNTDDFLVAVRNSKWAILSKYAGTATLQLDGPSASTNWDMVTIFRNSTHIGISVNDGTPVTQAFTGSINTNAVVRGLGTSGSYNLLGNLDEVGMWQRALNSTEISCLYNSGSGLAYSNFSTCGAGPANTNPTITPIADQIMLEDTRLNVTSAFTIADAEDLPSALTLSYTSSNTSVLNSTGAITFNVNSITGLTDMLQITPNADAFGATNVTIRVTDTGALYNESTFELVVTNVNDAPTISQSIPDVNTTSSLTNQINFTIFDIDSAYPDMSYTLNYVAPLLFSPIAGYTPSYTNGTSQHINVTAKNTYGEANVQIRVTDSAGAFADSNVFNYRVNCDSALLSTLIQSANATTPNNIPCWYQDFSSDIDTDIYIYTWDDFLNSVDSVEIEVYKTTGNQRTLIESDSSTASSGNFTFNYTATNPSDDLLFIVTMTDTSRNWSVGNSRQFSYSVSQQPDFASQFSVNDGIIYGVLLLFLFFTIGVASQSASLTLIFGLLGLFLANFLVLRLPSYFIWIAGVVVLIILWFMAKLRTD